MDLYSELLHLIDALNSAQLGYAVCGGIAVAIYGYPRFTKDIDLLIRSEDLARVLKTIEPRGFIDAAGSISFDTGGPQERVVHRISKIEGAEILTLDLLLVSPALEDVWQQREMFQWQGRALQLVSAEGLAKMKRLAGRDQDLLDLKKLGFADEQDAAAGDQSEEAD
jgi:hypothetical protein